MKPRTQIGRVVDNQILPLQSFFHLNQRMGHDFFPHPSRVLSEGGVITPHCVDPPTTSRTAPGKRHCCGSCSGDGLDRRTPDKDIGGATNTKAHGSSRVDVADDAGDTSTAIRSSSPIFGGVVESCGDRSSSTSSCRRCSSVGARGRQSSAVGPPATPGIVSGAGGGGWMRGIKNSIINYVSLNYRMDDGN